MTHQQDERGDPITRTHDPVRKDYPARSPMQQSGTGGDSQRVTPDGAAN